MKYRRKITPFLFRLIAAILSALLASEIALADAGQASLWSERRRATPTQRTQLASAAMGMSSEVGRLFGSLPRPASAVLSPSIANQLSRVEAPSLKKRLADVVRALPAQNGTVRDVVRGRPGMSDRIIVHIQDVHLNPEAQRHIAEAVRGLIGHAGVVALEGSVGPIRLKPFQGFPDRSTMKAVADYLLSENKISGPVSVAMTETGAPDVVGVDSREHYDRNVEAYRRSAPLQKAARERIEGLRRALAERKRSVYAQPLSRFDASVVAFDKGELPLGGYVRVLAATTNDVPLSVQAFLSAYEIESNLDFNRVESERSRLLAALVAKLRPAEIDRLVGDSLDYRLGRIGSGTFYGEIRDLAAQDGVRLADYPAMDSYVRYVLLSDSIRPNSLYRDIDTLRAGAYHRLATTPPERALVAEDERLGLAQKLVNFALTPDEWTRYQALPPLSLHADGIDLTSFEDFYREADARNDALTANLLKAMDDTHAKVGILVTGGFHAPGVGERLARAGVSMISYVPRLTKVDADGSAYLSVFTQEKTPLDRLFEGPRLFTAPDPAPQASLNLAAVLDAARATELGSVPADELRTWFRGASGFELRGVEKTGLANVFRVFFAHGDGVSVGVLVRPLENGGFEIREDVAGSRFRALTNLRAELKAVWGRARRRARAAAAAAVFEPILRRVSAAFHRIGIGPGLEKPFEAPVDPYAERLPNLDVKLPEGTAQALVTPAFLVDQIREPLARAGFKAVGEPVPIGRGMVADIYRILLVRSDRDWTPGQPPDTSLVLKIAGGDQGFELTAMLNSLEDDVAALGERLPGMPIGHGAVTLDGNFVGVLMDYSREIADGTSLGRATDLWRQGYRQPVPLLDRSGVQKKDADGFPLFEHPMSQGEIREQVARLIAGNERVHFWDTNGKDNFRVYNGRVYQVDPGAYSSRPSPRSQDQMLDDVLSGSPAFESPTAWAVALNTTFVLAPLFTAVTMAVLAYAGLASTALIPVIYLLYKGIFFLSVVIHEAAHLWIDGQFKGQTLRRQVALAFGALNRRNIWTALLLGTDISNAYIVSSEAKKAAVSQATKEEVDHVSQVAIAGPLANLMLVAMGGSFALAIASIGPSDPAQIALLIFGGMVAAVNVFHLAAAVAAALLGLPGSDLIIWRTQRAPRGIFRALGGRQPSGSRSIEPDDEESLAPGETASGPIRMGKAIVVGPASMPKAVRIARTRSGFVATFDNDGNMETVPMAPGRTYYFGRHPTVDFAVDDAVHHEVSRFHLAIKVSQNGMVTVADLFSRNHTKLRVENEGWSVRSAEASAQPAPAQPRGDESPAPEAESEPDESLASLHHTEFSAALNNRVPVNDFSAVAAPAPENDTSEAAVRRRVNEELPRLKAAPTANGDEIQQMQFFHTFLPILLSKHDGTISPTFRAAVREAIVGYMNEAVEIDEREVPLRGTLRPDGPTRVSSAFSTDAELGRKKRYYTTRIALKGNNAIRISVRLTETGIPLALGIDRHSGTAINKPLLLSGSVAGLPMLGRYLVSLVDVQYLSFDFDAVGNRILVTLHRAGGAVQRLALTLPTDDDTSVSLSAATPPVAPTVARREPPPVTKTDRDTVLANLERLSARSFEFAVARARARGQGAAQVDLDFAVDANGEIIATGERERFPPDVMAGVAAGTTFIVRVRARAPTAPGTYLTVISGDMPPEVRRRLEISLEVQSDRRAAVLRLRKFNREQLIGATEGPVKSNIGKIFSDNVEELADAQWFRGNAEDEHALVIGVLRPGGDIFSFSSPDDIPSALQRAIEQRLLYAVALRVRMVGAGDRYEVSTANAPAAVLEPVIEAVRLANAAVRTDHALVATDDLDVGAALARRPPVVSTPAPAAPATRINRASLSDGEAEIDRQLDLFDNGLVLVFRGPNLPSAGALSDAFMVREGEARRQLRSGTILAFRDNGRVVLVYAEGPPPGAQPISVDPAQSLALRPRPAAAPAATLEESEQSIVGGTIAAIRHRFTEAMREIGENAEPKTAEQRQFLRDLLDRLAGTQFTERQKDKLADGMLRLFSLRSTPMRVGPNRVYFSEDQGSGETIMGLRVEDFLGEDFFGPGDQAPARVDLLMDAYEAFVKEYRFAMDEGLGSGQYRARRERAVRRWRERLPEFLKLVNEDEASPEMIATAIEALRMLPLDILNRTSGIANRLQRGINLAAPRDQAARIGHYDDKDGGQLGIQPTVFQFVEFIETLLHEFGHVAQERHIAPGSRLLRLFAAARPNTYAIPALGFSAATRQGYIQSTEEMFAETFMHYVLHGELFSRGFPGYTKDTKAWRDVYAYYRDEVFGGVEFRNGRPTRRAAPTEPEPEPEVERDAPVVEAATPKVIRRKVAGGVATESDAGVLPVVFTIGDVAFSARDEEGHVFVRIAGNPRSRPITGLSVGQKLRLPANGKRTSFGRLATSLTDAGYHVRVNSEVVSRDHAEIYIDPKGNLVIEEHAPTNEVTVEPENPGLLTLPSTRAWAAARGYDPNGAFTELVLAPWLEGRGFQHFVRGFLGQHGEVTPAMRAGAALIWFVGLVAAILAATAVGVNVAPLLKSGSIVGLALAMVATSAIVISFAGGLWAGGMAGHLIYNGVTRIVRRFGPRLAERLGLRPLTVEELPRRLQKALQLPNNESAWTLAGVTVRGRTMVVEGLARATAIYRADEQGNWAEVTRFSRITNVAVSDDGDVVAFEPAGQGPIVTTFEGTEFRSEPLTYPRSTELALSRDGRHLFALWGVAATYQVTVFRIEGGVPVPIGAYGVAGPTLANTVSPEGRYVVSDEPGHPVRVLDADHGLNPVGGPLADEAVSLVISGNGSIAAFITPDDVAHFYAVDETGADEIDNFFAERTSLTRIETGVIAVTHPFIGPSRVYWAEGGDLRDLRTPFGAGPRLGESFSADGRVAAALFPDRAVVYRLIRGFYQEIARYPVAAGEHSVGKQLGLSADGRTLAVIDAVGVVTFHRITPNGIRRLGVVDELHGETARQVAYTTVQFSPDGGDVRLEGATLDGEAVTDRVGLAAGAPMILGQNDHGLSVSFHDYVWRLMVASAKGVQNNARDGSAPYDRFDALPVGTADNVERKADLPDLFIGLEQGSLPAVGPESHLLMADVIAGALTLPTTRAWAAARGFDPDGAFTELVLAPWLEGRGFQHFFRGFLGQHGEVTPAMRVGVGVIWLTAIVTALIASTAVGINVAPFLKSGSVVTLALAALAVSSMVVSFAGGLWAGGILGHFLYNAVTRLVRHFAPRLAQRLGLRPLTTARSPAARVGDGLIAAARDLVRRRGQPNLDEVLGQVVDLHVGTVFIDNQTSAPVAPAAVRREDVVAYLRANLDGRLKAGDLTLVEAQQIAEKLSEWLGDTVTLGNKEVVVVVRSDEHAQADLDDVAKIVAARQPGAPPVDVVVSPDQAEEATTRFGNRAHIIVTQGPVVTAAGSLDFGVFQQAVEADRTGLSTRLSNVLLVISKDVSVSSTDLPANSPLRAMGYKSLEDVVENLLTPIQVLPLGTVIDAARVLAVQA